MTDAIALLWPPFLVALCLIGIHTYFGIQVLSRNVIFVDLALKLLVIYSVACAIGYCIGRLIALGWHVFRNR